MKYIMAFEFSDGSFRAWSTEDPTELVQTARHVAIRNDTQVKTQWWAMGGELELQALRRLMSLSENAARDAIAVFCMNKFSNVVMESPIKDAYPVFTP